MISVRPADNTTVAMAARMMGMEKTSVGRIKKTVTGNFMSA